LGQPVAILLAEEIMNFIRRSADIKTKINGYKKNEQ
jgi:hypothetical protein